LYSGNPQFKGRIDYVFNITILNFLNETIAQGNYAMPSDRIIEIGLSIYILTIWNQCPEFIYFNLTSSGGAIWSKHMGQEIIRIALYASTDYTYNFQVVEGPSAGSHTGTINIGTDTGIKIDSWDSLEIYQGISRVGGGGPVSVEDLYVALNAVQGGILNQVQFYSWLSVIMLFVGLYAIPFIKNRGKISAPKDVPEFSEEYDGEPEGYGASAKRERKRPVPKQLEKHTFKEGLLNPKFRGGPSMQDMSDQVWGALRGEKKKKKGRK
jgi:hypothetical protein